MALFVLGEQVKRQDATIGGLAIGTSGRKKSISQSLRAFLPGRLYGGGNYFTDYLPPFKGFIVWDKRCDEKMSNDYADCELAYLSDGMGVARVFRFLWNGMLQGDMKNKEGRFHPTQKPVQLYTWIISNYAKPGDKLLDTHAGSGSSLVAAHRMGYDMIGFEIDEEYYKMAKERLEQEKAQISLIDVIGKLP